MSEENNNQKVNLKDNFTIILGAMAVVVVFLLVAVIAFFPTSTQELDQITINGEETSLDGNSTENIVYNDESAEEGQDILNVDSDKTEDLEKSEENTDQESTTISLEDDSTEDKKDFDPLTAVKKEENTSNASVVKEPAPVVTKEVSYKAHWIQVGSFSSLDTAQNLERDLHNQGFEATKIGTDK